MSKTGCLMFIRIEEGVYMFGTKRTSAKIVNDSLLLRVGGGYMNIEEFVRQYNDKEKEKLEILRTKPEYLQKRFNFEYLDEFAES